MTEPLSFYTLPSYVCERERIFCVCVKVSVTDQRANIVKFIAKNLSKSCPCEKFCDFTIF